MDQAESLCDHVCIMAKGRKAVEGPLEVLKAEAAAEGLIELAFNSPDDQQRASEGVLVDPIVESVRASKAGLDGATGAHADSDKLLALLVEAKLGVRRFERQQASLHQIFVVPGRARWPTPTRRGG